MPNNTEDTLLLAFANEDDNHHAHLPNLRREESRIGEALERAQKERRCQISSHNRVTADTLTGLFDTWREETSIFHFGGHAGSKHILLNQEDRKGVALAHAKGLVPFLTQQPNLKLVFLNGCHSQPIAEQLHKAGISSIGTTYSVNDEVAQELAVKFYEQLAQGLSIETAWKQAQNGMAMKYDTENLRNLCWEGMEKEKAPQTIEELWIARIHEQHAQYQLKARGKYEKILLDAGAPIPDKFMGRDDALKEIHQKVFSKNENVLLLVNGEGGIGKTSLAAKYWQQYESDYLHLAWVLAQESLANALLDLAKPLQLEFDPKTPTEERIDRILLTLHNLGKPCLLVIDNADNPSDLKQYYKALKSCPNFHVLLTTRVQKLGKIDQYRVQPLEEGWAIKLFASLYEDFQEEDSTLLKEILQAVGRNTLVIELMAKFMEEKNDLGGPYPLQQLLSDLQGRGLLQSLSGEIVETEYQSQAYGLREAEPKEVITAMYDLGQLSTEAQELMQVFAFLPAENIPLSRLQVLLPHRQLKPAFQELRQKGWLDYSETLIAFRASPVVQEVVRANLPKEEPEVLKGVVGVLKEKLEPEHGYFKNHNHEELSYCADYAGNWVAHYPYRGHNLGVLLSYIGNFQQSIGNLQEALKYFEEFKRLEKELHEQFPNQVSFKNLLAISYQYLGITHSSLGNLQEALKYFEEYNRLKKQLHEQFPEQVDFKNGLAISYEKLGETHSSLGNLQEALKYFEECNRLAKELHEQFPQQVEFKNLLAISYEKLGGTHSSLGNLQQASKFFEEYNRLKKQLHEQFPQQVSFKNGLAISYEKLGETHSSLGNLQEALKFFEDETVLFEELHKQFPEQVDFKNGLAISYEKLGGTHSSLGNLTQALKYFEEYNCLEKELHKQFPDQVDFKNGLAISYEKLGGTHSSLGNLQEALKYFEEFKHLEKELHEQFPDQVGFKNSLAISYSKLGSTHSKLGNLHEALKYYELDLQLSKELHKQFPDQVGFKNSLAISYSKLGSTHSSLGNLQQALKYFEEFKHLEKELHEQFPQQVDFKNGLAISYERLGKTHSDLGNLQEALKYFEECNRLAKELHEQFPQQVEFKNLLASSYQFLGYTHSSLGNLQQVLKYFEEYKRLEKELYEAHPTNVEFKFGYALSLKIAAQIMLEKYKTSQAKDYILLSEKLMQELVDASEDYRYKVELEQIKTIRIGLNNGCFTFMMPFIKLIFNIPFIKKRLEKFTEEYQQNLTDQHTR